MNRLTLFCVLAAAVVPAMGQNYTISTFAGGGPNDVNATILPVGDVGGVVNDSSGNCYFSSITLNRIFRVDSTGTLFVVAGYGLAGNSGDGGPAAAAGLSGPTYLALDQNGYLYISDAGNNRVRRVQLSTGIITNFAGTGTASFGGDGSAATSAQLNTPKGISADTAGNVYIADSANNRIRIVNSTGIINTFAGTGTAGYNGDNIAANSAKLNAPSGLAFDTVNNRLYIADELNYRIRLVASGSISTVVDQSGVASFSGDGNAAVSATINRPQGLALDGSTNLFIADAYNFRIRRVAVSNGVIGNISTVAGSGQLPPPVGNGGPASAARLNYPTAVSLDRANNLYIADRLDDMVRTVPSPYGSSTNISVLAGNGAAISPVTFFGDNGLATNAVLTNPFGTAISADGNTLLIADQQDNIVRSVNVQTGIITTVAGNGTAGHSGNGGAAISSQLDMPYGVALDSSRNIYIADFGNNRIQKVDISTGNIGTYAGSATGASGYSGDNGPAASALLNGPVGLAFDAANDLFVGDFNNDCVRRIAGDTQIITTVIGNCTKSGVTGDGGPPTAATALLNRPEGVAVNSAGTVIYVADTYNNKVRWVNNSLLNTFAGTGTASFLDGVAANQAELNFPSGVALDNLGNLFIGDAFNNRVRKVQAGNANNIISTVAGGSTAGFGGDGGPATSAELASPYGVTANPITDGVYVSDYGNNRVRLLSLECTYQISPPNNLTIPAAGGSYSITVTTNPTSGCPWSATVPAGVGWITITSGSSGNGSGTVDYSVSANSGASLSTTLTVANNSFPVTQAAGVTCTYSVSPARASASAAGGTGSVTVTAPGGCAWTAAANASWLKITSGSSGNGNGTADYSVAANTGSNSITGTLTVAGQTVTITEYGTSSLQLLTVAPCRVMDTRNANGALGGPFIGGGTTRTIPIPSSSCGIPGNAVAYSLNITVVPRTGTLGYLTVWPTGLAQPLVSTLNSLSGLVLANAAIVPAGTSGSINAFASNDTDLIVDINGYFVPPATGTLQFYTLQPCRVLDTRNPTGTFGGPSIQGGSSRSFPIPSSSCGVPAGAAAYSLNVTVVPQGELGYLTAWPTGQTQPVVSTLNSLNGTVLANAAIVPAGTGGAASFFASNTTDLVVDINGYFAAPASSGLDFYTATPCRLVDTRNTDGTFGGPTLSAGTTRVFPLSLGSCGLPGYPTAQAYSLNMTVVPQGPLGYLTTWPTGGTQPGVSTLNAVNGQVVANAAIVPASSSGSISVFVTNTTDVIIDTNGYFGP